MNKILIILFFAISFAISTNDIYDDSWALIIGIDKYENVQKLNYAVDDAESIKDILINSFDFPVKNVSILINEEASKENIMKSFSTITKSAKSNDRVVVFFAGHGETMDLPGGGEKGYLIPVEGDASDLYLTSIPMDELKQIALMSEAKHMLYLVDACYGGIAAVGSRGLVKEEAPNYLKKITKFPSRQVITAGGRGEKVIEKAEWGHSAFTLNIKRGLKDGAADMNSDGYITANELGMFLSERVTIDSENQQTPQYGRMTSQEGEFIFRVNDENVIVEQKNVSEPVDYEKLAIIIADKIGINSINKADTSASNIFLQLDSLGVKIDSEKIEKVNNFTDNVKNKIGLSKSVLVENTSFINSQSRYYTDIEYLSEDSTENSEVIPTSTSDNWLRYNRSEGLYYQINSTLQSQYIKGSSLYGGVGRSFHRNEYQWIIGIEQLFFHNSIQFYFESFNKSMTADAWRVWDGANSLSAFFRRQDYLDWYKAKGEKAAIFFHLKNYFSFGIEYNQFKQSPINNIIKKESFSDSYSIQAGKNHFINNIFSLGYPIDLSIKDKFQIYTKISSKKSINTSDLEYVNENFYFNILVPYAENLNLNCRIMLGASDVLSQIWNELGFYQNIYEIGGEGTLRGYDWKSIRSSHYQLISIESWFNYFGIFYDRAILFESPGNTFNLDYINDLLNASKDDAKNSFGLIFGKENVRLTYSKQLNDKKETSIVLTFGKPLSF